MKTERITALITGALSVAMVAYQGVAGEPVAVVVATIVAALATYVTGWLGQSKPSDKRAIKVASMRPPAMAPDAMELRADLEALRARVSAAGRNDLLEAP